MQIENRKNVPFNFIVNVLDGSFFGMSLGFASFVTVIPLFVSKFTDSSLLIGLIASLHMVGWQLPQILTANHVARLTRYKPMVVRMTVHERWPFLGLALVAVFAEQLGTFWVLVLITILVTIQAFAGGFAATAWQSMIAKLIPPARRGTFYGTQSSAANMLSSVGAALAGLILLASDSSNEGFALNFVLAGLLMFVSFAFIIQNREAATPPAMSEPVSGAEYRAHLVRILRTDGNYRLFIAARMFIQAASIGAAFFTVFAVRRFNMDEGTSGLMTSIFLICAMIGNPISGWLGDRYNRRIVFAVGGLLAGLSGLLALLATDVSWYYVAFALLGLSNGAAWTSANAMTADFGTERERPYYIALVNTLIAPATLLAPVIGGWLADLGGSDVPTLLLIVITGALTSYVAFFMMRDPHGQPSRQKTLAAERAEPVPIAPHNISG